MANNLIIFWEKYKSTVKSFVVQETNKHSGSIPRNACVASET